MIVLLPSRRVNPKGFTAFFTLRVRLSIFTYRVSGESVTLHGAPDLPGSIVRSTQLSLSEKAPKGAVHHHQRS